MHINPIQINTLHNNSAKIKKNNSNVTIATKSLPMPTSAHYLSFMGGSSLNLKESIQNLEKISKEGEDKFPKGIKEDAQEVIKSGNPENKTLIDVHKNKYSLLKDCYNLDDAKALYDEFSGVISDNQVEYMPDSFVDRVKKGEVENFNKDEDLAFQLLKLYWADGFSLTDLKRYSGTDLYHTLKKFNIPMMDKDYAHVLKFSDKEYNERLTKEMAQKRAESMERRLQEKEGEPVFIPRGPLSDIHKKHISEGLIQYYAKHPEKRAEMSQRQIEYFKNNPEQAELMGKAMDYAWNKTQEGMSIKRQLSKFFKKQRVTFDKNSLSDEAKMTPEQRAVMSDFWAKNAWARDLFSKATISGWEYVKNRKNTDININDVLKVNVKYNLIPAGYVDDVRKWTLEKGISTLGVDFQKLKTQNYDEDNCRSFAILSALYTKNIPMSGDFITSSLGAALISIRNEIFSNKIPPKYADNIEFLKRAAVAIDQLYYPEYRYGDTSEVFGEPRPVNYDQVVFTLDMISKYAIYYNQDSFITYLKNKLDKGYEIITNPHTQVNRQKFYDFVGTDPFDALYKIPKS